MSYIDNLGRPTDYPPASPKLYPLTMGEVYENAQCYECPTDAGPKPAIGAVLDDPDPAYLCRRPLCADHAKARGARP